MPCYVGLDASKTTTNICVIDENGIILEEGTTESDPKAIVTFLRGKGRRYARIGMEAWALSSWLYAGMVRAGLPVIVIEAKHAHHILRATRRNKTDRNDARGIAELMRAKIYKAVHVKTAESQRIQALMTARRIMKSKGRDIDNAIRSILLTFGKKLGKGISSTFSCRVRKLIEKDDFLIGLIEPMLTIRTGILEQVKAFDTRMDKMAFEDPICRRLMTAPAVGPVVALTYRAVIDEPRRFSRSRNVGVHLGLTPRTNQSGDEEFRGRISKCGDKVARAVLYLAAAHQLKECTRPSWLKTWAGEVRARRGGGRAIVAVARRLAVILHQMWLTDTDFRWEAEPA